MGINSLPHSQLTAGARDHADRKFKFSAGYQRHPYLTLESGVRGRAVVKVYSNSKCYCLRCCCEELRVSRHKASISSPLFNKLDSRDVNNFKWQIIVCNGGEDIRWVYFK